MSSKVRKAVRLYEKEKGLIRSESYVLQVNMFREVRTEKAKIN